MDLNKLVMFHDICRHKNLSEAAKSLNVDKSTLSRNLTNLEKELDVTLFCRINRRLVLTQEGRFLSEKMAGIIGDVRGLKTTLGCIASDISGDLKISTTHPIASTWLPPIISGFLSQYPLLRVEIKASAETLDLSMREADLALRPMCLMSHVKHELLHRWRLTLWASQDYIAQFGVPKNVDDLDNHRLIVFGDTTNLYNDDHAQWSLKRGPGRTKRVPYVITNSLQGMFELVKMGVGIGTFSSETFFMKDSGLIQILGNEIYKDVDLFFIVHSNMEENKKIQAFKSYIYKYLKGNT